MDDRRLDRIEGKLDKLSEVITAIARVEEKLLAGSGRIDRLENRADKHGKEIDELKKVSQYNHTYVKTIERFAWILISAVIGLATYYVR